MIVRKWGICVFGNKTSASPFSDVNSLRVFFLFFCWLTVYIYFPSHSFLLMVTGFELSWTLTPFNRLFRAHNTAADGLVHLSGFLGSRIGIGIRIEIGLGHLSQSRLHYLPNTTIIYMRLSWHQYLMLIILITHRLHVNTSRV